jgi:hypothetical protein
MEEPNRERWREPCAKAAVEQDAAKLLDLIREINSLLEQKENNQREQGLSTPVSAQKDA